MKYDSKADTLEHIRRVNSLILGCCANLQKRAERHDSSKLQEPEKSVFDENTEKLRGLTYGSDEYKASLAALGPALAHHYAHNSHHPEHYENGVSDMSLFDLLEMLMDWKAAGERHANGSIVESLKKNQPRFKIDPQLQSVLENTAREMGWTA